MNVEPWRYQQVVNEIQVLRMQKVGKIFNYSTLRDEHPHYRDRVIESHIAAYTRKIERLEAVKERYENDK